MQSFSILDVNYSAMDKDKPNLKSLGTNLTDDLKLKQNFEMKKRHSLRNCSDNARSGVSGNVPDERLRNEDLHHFNSMTVSSMNRQSIPYLKNCARYDEKVEDSIIPQITQLAKTEPEKKTIDEQEEYK